jgi:exopolysaccharide production protein ExoQ
MPPLFALALCALFVWIALTIERQKSRAVSGAVWIPLIWLLVTASKPLGVWFGTASDDGGSELDQIFGVTLLILGLAILASRGVRWSVTLGNNPWLAVLLIYMALSVFWSEVPETSFKRWGREAIAVVMACVVASEKSPRQAMEAILRRSAYVLVPTSLVLIKYFPILGVQYRQMGGQMWVGAATQKNGLGRLCLIAAFFIVWSLLRSSERHSGVRQVRWTDTVVLALSAYLLMGPGEEQFSATALASACVGFAAYAFLCWRRRAGATPGIVTVALPFCLVFAIGTLQPYWGGSIAATVASEFGRDVTLTGRTEIWGGLVPEVWSRPLLGSGVESFWTDANKRLHDIGEAHNGYLDVALSLGFVGLAIVFLFLLVSCLKAQREMVKDFEWGCLWYCCLLMAAVHNVTESSFNSFTAHIMSTVLFFALASAPVNRTSRRYDDLATPQLGSQA